MSQEVSSAAQWHGGNASASSNLIRNEDVPVPMLVQPTAAHLTLHGHRIAYRTAGQGPVVVLVHGMAGSALTWRHAMPALRCC